MQNLIKMANQISSFFESQGDAEMAREAIATHLRNFWAPSMRKDLLKLVDSGEAETLRPLVKEAAEQFRPQLLNAEASIPGEGRWDGPKGGGDAG